MMRPFRKKKTFKRFLMVFGSLLLVFLSLQCFHQPIEARPLTETINAPKEVMAILRRSCFNCHSNEQNLKWYDQLAPVSWAVHKDVTRAREVMNFSEWKGLSAGELQGKMFAILNMMQAGKMPLPAYLITHPAARISKADIEVIKNFTLSLSPAIAPHSSTPQAMALPLQMADKMPQSFPVSPNGLKYTNEFKHWKVVSMSTLFDHSIRVIFGNDIAVRAIETENLHPWPDGSIIVKAVWQQKINEYGDISAGKFINAQFMEKNSRQYQDTEGWGFAKFSGERLTPTGETAGFARQSCISCHRQLAESTGYLFSVPLKINPEFLILKNK